MGLGSLANVGRDRLMPIVMLGMHLGLGIIGHDLPQWSLLPKVAWPPGP